MHKIPQKSTSVPSKDLSSTSVQAHAPQLKHTGQISEATETIFNGTANSNLSNLLQGITSNINLTAPVKQTQKENQNQNLIQTNQLSDYQNTQHLMATENLNLQTSSGQRKASDGTQNSNQFSSNSQAPVGIQSNGMASQIRNAQGSNLQDKKQSPNFVPRKSQIQNDRASQYQDLSQHQGFNFQAYQTQLYQSNQFGSTFNKRVNHRKQTDKSSLESTAQISALASKIPKTLQAKSGSPGQKSSTTQWQRLNEHGLNFDYLASSNQSSAINSKQGTQLINKKVLQSANQIINEIYAQEQMLRSNIKTGKSKKQSDKNFSLGKISTSAQNQNRSSSNMSGQALQTYTNILTDSLQPTSIPTSQNLQATESSENNTQVTVIQVVEKDSKERSLVSELKKRVQIGKRNDSKSSILNRSGNYTTQTVGTRGNSGKRGSSALKQIYNPQGNMNQKASKLSKSNIQNVRRSKGNIEFKGQDSEKFQDILRQPLKSAQQPQWNYMNKSGSRQELNQSQVIKVRSPLIKDGENASDQEERHRLFAIQQRQNMCVQEFEDFDDEDDDYQFSSQVKKSNNTVLNSDESEKQKTGSKGKPHINNTKLNQIQKFELSAFENSNEDYQSSSKPQHNFYMTQVIKNADSKTNIQFGGHLDYDQSSIPLRLGQNQLKNDSKLSSKVIQNHTNNASLRQSNLKISKSQLKSYNNTRGNVDRQSVNQAAIANSLNYHPLSKPTQEQHLGTSYVSDSLSKSGQNTRKSQPSPLNNKLKDQQNVLEKYLAQNNIIDNHGLQQFGMSNYQKHIQNSNFKQHQQKQTQKKKSNFNCSSLIAKTPNINHKTFDQTQPLPYSRYPIQQKALHSQNNNQSISKVNQSGYSDYLNSTAPLNLTQLNQNQNEESFYYGLFNSGAGVPLSNVVNSTHNLRRISSKESWKNNTQGILDQSLLKGQFPSHFNQVVNDDLSSYPYYSSHPNQSKMRLGSNSIEKNYQQQLQRGSTVIGGSNAVVKPQKIQNNRIQNLMSPPKDIERKKSLIKNILMQDSLNQQKNKKYFLNLTLQQLIQQQKQDQDMPCEIYLTDQSQIKKQDEINKRQLKRLNKTLDNRRLENMNSNSQVRIVNDQVNVDQAIENQDAQDQTQDLLQFINNFTASQSNGLHENDHTDEGRKSRQQTKSFRSSVNKFSNTMKVSEFNNTQQIFEGIKNQSLNQRQKSKSSLKSTQNFNLRDEGLNKGQVVKSSGLNQQYGGQLKLQPTSLSSQLKQRKIVKPGAVHIQNQVSSKSQSRLSQNTVKHQKQGSQDEKLLQQMLNIYQELDPQSQKQLEDQGFDIITVLSQQNLAKITSSDAQQPLTTYNAYNQRVNMQSKFKTNQTLNNYLSNNSKSNKSLGQSQQLNKNSSVITSQKSKGAKQSMSNSFIKQVNIEDPMASKIGANLIRLNGEYSKTTIENKNPQVMQQCQDILVCKTDSQNTTKKGHLEAYQRQIQKDLAKSALIQDLSSFGIAIPSSNINIQKKNNQNEFQSLSQVKKYQQKAANLITVQQNQLNQANDMNNNLRWNSNYQSNPYNFVDQLRPSKPQSSKPVPAKKQSISQLKIQKDLPRDTQNRTQPIPKHILEMALAASTGEESECNVSNQVNIKRSKVMSGVNQGTEIYSSGNSIIINKQQNSRERKSSQGLNKSFKDAQCLKTAKQRKQESKVLMKQNDQQFDKNINNYLQLQQKTLNKQKVKEDDPCQIYGNKNAVILEEIQGRYKDSLESQEDFDENQDDLLEDSSQQDSFSKLDRFVLGKQVGQGAYAVVRVATHKKTNKKYAIKVYDKSKLTDTNRQRSVRREIKLLQKMSHQNIVKIYEAFETDDHVYLVMEYVAGDNLYGYLKQHKHSRLEEKEAKRIFKQLLTALAYCHRKSIAHRDIKLENILLDESNNVKLIDFGFSTCIPNDKKIKMFCGTPSYMAPEIVNKEEYAGPPADIWASGVLLFALMNGKFPFRGDTDRDLYRRINRGTFEICNPQISPYLLNFLSRMINTNADDRPSAEELLQDRWFQVNDQEEGEESQAQIEERERLRQEYIAEQKKQFKAKILSKGFLDKQKNNIQVINQNNDSGNKKLAQLHNIDLGNTSHIQINPNNIMPGFRQSLINQGYQNFPNSIQQQDLMKDYGNTQQMNMKRLNQEAYQAYYNTSGNNYPNWGAGNNGNSNPYYNNFFIQGQGNFSNPISHPSFLSNIAQSNNNGINHAIQNRASPSKMHINTNHQIFPINFAQQSNNSQQPNQIGTPQVFASPTGFTCQANMINNNFNIINNITQVTCLPPSNVEATSNLPNFQNLLSQNLNFNKDDILNQQSNPQNQRQQRSETVIQVRQDSDISKEKQRRRSREEDIDEEIVESIIKMGGYHRSHVVSQLDLDSSEIAGLYNQLKDEKLSKTQTRPLSLQPYNKIKHHGFLIEDAYKIDQEGQEILDHEEKRFSPHEAYSYLNNHTFGKKVGGQNFYQRSNNPHNNKVYPHTNYNSSLSDSENNNNFQPPLINHISKARGEKILMEDQRELQLQEYPIQDQEEIQTLENDQIVEEGDSTSSPFQSQKIQDIKIEIQST